MQSHCWYGGNQAGKSVGEAQRASVGLPQPGGSALVLFGKHPRVVRSDRLSVERALVSVRTIGKKDSKRD
jgi:hypothetical protein